MNVLGSVLDFFSSCFKQQESKHYENTQYSQPRILQFYPDFSPGGEYKCMSTWTLLCRPALALDSGHVMVFPSHSYAQLSWGLGDG